MSGIYQKVVNVMPKQLKDPDYYSAITKNKPYVGIPQRIVFHVIPGVEF